jgi:membrane protein YdbS with pleckstrin-like domain
MQLPYGNRSVLSAFMPLPEKIRFDAQQENEKLYLLMRKHQITNIPWVLGGAFALVLPILLLGVIQFGFPEVDVLAGIGYGFLLTLFWYLLVSIYIFEQFLLWFFHVFIITNDRLIDIDFTGLFNKEFSETQITRVQDVTSEVRGPLQVMFDYGYVAVQTAAEQTEIQFENVPRPDQVSKLIGELVAEKGGSMGVHSK